MKKNWLTTLFGILGLAAKIAAMFVPEHQAALDGASTALLTSGLAAAADARKARPKQ
jgi:hypothetical protein